MTDSQEDETARLRDEVVKRMLATPPQPKKNGREPKLAPEVPLVRREEKPRLVATQLAQNRGNADDGSAAANDVPE